MIYNTTGIFAGMFNKKTTKLLEHQNKYYKNESIIYRPKIDTRELCTHDGIKYKAKSISNIAEMNGAFSNKIKCVYFDEIQFFESSIEYDEFIEQVKQIARIKPVFLAGLDYDFRLQPFPLVEYFMKHCEHIIELKTYCKKCGKFSKTYSKRLNSNQEQIEIGGEEAYEPRCLDCFNL